MSKRKIAFLSLSLSLMLTLLAAGVFGQAMQRENLYRFLSIFTEVFSLAKSNYVDEVAPDHLVEGAFAGVTDAIDEFSYYVPPAQMREYGDFRDQAGVSDGIGLILTKRFGYAYVIAPIEGSPGDEAGIEPGDFVERIDGLPTQKMSIWEMRKALQGREGSTVRLGVLRGGMSKRDEITLVRRPFVGAAVKLDYYGTVAYVKIPNFRPGAAQQFTEILDRLQSGRRRKLIIDVRSNAFGTIDEAIAAADALLVRGVITSLSGRRIEPKRWEADNAWAFDGDVLVLTDGSTAGPGEIFAAAVAGNGRGRLVGVATFGMAVHQRFVPLPSGGGLYITIAHYTTPELKPIKEQGVRPDVTVDLAALALQAEDGKKPEEDLILNKALRLFGEILVHKAAA